MDEAELDEMSFGLWEGKEISSVFQEIRAISKVWASGNVSERCPNGESPEQVLQRCRECMIDKILHPCWDNSKHIAVVAHSRINQVILSGLAGTGLTEMKNFHQGNACINVLDYDPTTGKFEVVILNDTKHLSKI